MREMEYLEELTSRYPVLEAVKGDVLAAYEILRDCYAGGGKVMIAGNGGSCADSEHIVGELMKGFVKRRPVSGDFAAALKKADEKRGEELASCLQGGLPAIALTGHAGLSTAFLNDVNGEMIYAQQLYGYGKKGDVFMGISTSGNAENVMYAVAVAKASGIKTIGLTGKNGGKMAGTCDCSIVVPSDETFKIQELHLPIYHALCLMLEEHFYEV
ncbi:D-sedoheptulose-7-phosphate isomerase [Enterocloster clostridioformis]|nr:SIS domain-containing protein [Enterocloster clostridioformis]